jgi:hypothetical protein
MTGGRGMARGKLFAPSSEPNFSELFFRCRH